MAAERGEQSLPRGAAGGGALSEPKQTGFPAPCQFVPAAIIFFEDLARSHARTYFKAISGQARPLVCNRLPAAVSTFAGAQ
jgi:hypothetical protein